MVNNLSAVVSTVLINTELIEKSFSDSTKNI